MPCDTITTQSVALAKAVPDVLRAAIVSAGMTVTAEVPGRIDARTANYESVIWTAGAGLTFRAAPARAEVLKRDIVQSYSRAAVTWSAQRAGWKVTATAGNKMTLQR